MYLCLCNSPYYWILFLDIILTGCFGAVVIIVNLVTCFHCSHTHMKKDNKQGSKDQQRCVYHLATSGNYYTPVQRMTCICWSARFWVSTGTSTGTGERLPSLLATSSVGGWCCSCGPVWPIFYALMESRLVKAWAEVYRHFVESFTIFSVLFLCRATSLRLCWVTTSEELECGTSTALGQLGTGASVCASS